VQCLGHEVTLGQQKVAESEIIFTVVQSPEGGYEAKALAYPIYTQADDLEELKAMVRDAVRCHFDENDRPRVIRLYRPPRCA